tara:strand:+ start:1049 stop:1258 length:210 start_codon:yes stop_codon:yes gene_type:complete
MRRPKVIFISLEEWRDYYRVQQSGEINMWSHPLIFKFQPDGNWQAAYDHFEEAGNTNILEIEDEIEDTK